MDFEKNLEKAKEMRRIWDKNEQNYHLLIKELQLNTEEKEENLLNYLKEKNVFDLELDLYLNSSIYLSSSRESTKKEHLSNSTERINEYINCSLEDQKKYKELYDEIYNEILKKYITNKQEKEILNIYRLLPTTSKKYRFYNKNKEILSNAYDNLKREV